MLNKEKTLIQIQDLQMNFKNRELFSNINLDIHAGEFISIIGPNGVGKTTLIRLILHELTPTKGKIIVNTAREKIGFVPQSRNIPDNFPLDIFSFVSLRLYHSFIPWLTKSDKQQVDSVLKEVNLEKRANNLLVRASGGEKQRSYIAQALINQPQIIILDEPTASLDNSVKLEVMALLKKLQLSRQVTIILVSHDFELVQQNSDVILQLHPDHTWELKKEVK